VTVIIILAILLFIFFFNLARNILPNILPSGGGGNGGSGGGFQCPTYCEGYGVTVAPQCNCPPGTIDYFVITNPPEYYGYKQCTCG
jgi:hypothetical protein